MSFAAGAALEGGFLYLTLRGRVALPQPWHKNIPVFYSLRGKGNTRQTSSPDTPDFTVSLEKLQGGWGRRTAGLRGQGPALPGAPAEPAAASGPPGEPASEPRTMPYVSALPPPGRSVSDPGPLSPHRTWCFWNFLHVVCCGTALPFRRK